MPTMEREFAEGDIIVSIGSYVLWVVWDVGIWGYEVRKLSAFLRDDFTREDDGDAWGGVSTRAAAKKYVKVGKWSFKEEVADYAE